jgi:hypothetical protein
MADQDFSAVTWFALWLSATIAYGWRFVGLNLRDTCNRWVA